MSIRAARTAGNIPPKRPITAAKTSDDARMPGVGVNSKLTSDQLAKFTMLKRAKRMSVEAPPPNPPPPNASTPPTKREQGTVEAI